MKYSRSAFLLLLVPFTGKAPSPHTIIIIFVFLAYGRKSLSVEDVIEEGKF
jgi:hypothetical protein